MIKSSHDKKTGTTQKSKSGTHKKSINNQDMTSKWITLDGSDLTLEDVKSISKGAKLKLDAKLSKTIDSSRSLVQKLSSSKTPYYGINTGFGFLANKKIDQDHLAKMQRNIITSHASGWGEPLSLEETRLSMALRLNVLIKGYTGVRLELCRALLGLINAEIYPIIPSYGSVGASGDLAPLAHLSLALIGEGKVHYKGKVMPALEALKTAKLSPIALKEKEGLSLINGTQIMLSIGSLALKDAFDLLEKAEKITALTFEAFVGNPTALDPRLHAVRRQLGQITSAEKILRELEGSYLLDKETKRRFVQDPYSLRCAPQVHGASRDTLNHTKNVIERELNAVTDNPLVFEEDEAILSGGNFHGQPIAMAFDIASIAVSELANISERRLELLVNPTMSGLPAFLSTDPGVDSGYMALQYLSASLVNENKLLANPSCTDSIPGNVGIEDHVSMGMTSARKLRRIVKNAYAVLAVELLAAAQAIDLRKTTKLGAGTKKLYHEFREHALHWNDEQILADDVEKACNFLLAMQYNLY